MLIIKIESPRTFSSVWSKIKQQDGALAELYSTNMLENTLIVLSSIKNWSTHDVFQMTQKMFWLNKIGTYFCFSIGGYFHKITAHNVHNIFEKKCCEEGKTTIKVAIPVMAKNKLNMKGLASKLITFRTLLCREFDNSKFIGITYNGDYEEEVSPNDPSAEKQMWIGHSSFEHYVPVDVRVDISPLKSMKEKTRDSFKKWISYLVDKYKLSTRVDRMLEVTVDTEDDVYIKEVYFSLYYGEVYDEEAKKYCEFMHNALITSKDVTYLPDSCDCEIMWSYLTKYLAEDIAYDILVQLDGASRLTGLENSWVKSLLPNHIEWDVAYDDSTKDEEDE